MNYVVFYNYHHRSSASGDPESHGTKVVNLPEITEEVLDKLKQSLYAGIGGWDSGYSGLEITNILPCKS